MTDKEKIRAEIERRYNERDRIGDNIRANVHKSLISFIDSMQEEPVNNPIDFEQELYKAFGLVKDFTLCMRIAKRFYDMGKNSQEPVSEELEAEIIRYVGYPQEVDEDISTTMIRKAALHFANWQKQQDSKLPKIWPRDTIEEYAYQCAYDMSNDWIRDYPEWTDVETACKLGAEWQKTKDESTTEDLCEYINELSKQFPEVSFAKLSRIAVRVANWQKEQMMAKAIDGKVIANGMGNPILHLWEKGRHLIDKKVKVIVIKKN